MSAPTPNSRPGSKNQVIIIGAGISGLLLAQYLRKNSIPFVIFERDTDFHTRGVGWGLTLHWSLPDFRALLPSDLVDRLPETYVDRDAVARGEVSTFPFYDLATERPRNLLAEGVEIQWGKSYKGYEISVDDARDQVVTVNLDDGTSGSGSLLMGCDGGRSRSSGNYTCQIVVSWPLRPGFFGTQSITSCPTTNEDRLDLVRKFANTWAEPFRSLVLDIPPGTVIKPVDLHDWPPPLSLALADQPVTLMGDAFHPMAMYRGEGANHAILDVLDFVETVFPEAQTTTVAVAGRKSLSDNRGFSESESLSVRLRKYVDKVVKRARPAVLASRRACMDAHNYKKIDWTSPLVSPRAMRVEFEDGSLGWDY
ncbi:putative FAD-dependent monooxygenase [Naviculisporaceae sp. PSN 640]